MKAFDDGFGVNNVAIVMASYNGEAFVKGQVESIQWQTFVKWKLLVRDDGSSDATVDLLESLAKDDARIEIVKDDLGPQQSAKGNFTILAQEALERGFRYLFFADQDDIWDETKLVTMITRMQQVEADNPDVPVMVHSDLVVVDDGDKMLAKSFFRFQGIRHEETSALNVLLVQNFVTGCASMVNRPLLEVALPFPQAMIMHDWWLALCATAKGQLAYVDKVLVRYRQHGKNSVGAKGFWTSLNPLQQNLFSRWINGKKRFIDTVDQARALRLLLKDLDDMESIQAPFALRVVDAYASILELSPIARMLCLQEYGIKRQNLLMNLALKLRIFFTRH